MRAWLLPALLTLIAACGTGRAVHEARLQPRRHLHGWHIDLGGRRHAGAEASASIRAARPERLAPRIAAQPVAPPSRRPIAHAAPISPATAARDERPRYARATSIQDAPQPGAAAPAHASLPQEELYAPEEKRWNRLAVPAFVAALGAVAAGFGTNLWLLAGLVALTLVLAAWSIARIRRRDQAGKGFAMAALVIGVLAALLTAISVARYGMEL